MDFLVYLPPQRHGGEKELGEMRYLSIIKWHGVVGFFFLGGGRFSLLSPCFFVSSGQGIAFKIAFNIGKVHSSCIYLS